MALIPLITRSLPEVKRRLAQQDSKLKHILVNTRADNYAQQIYQKLLGAEVEMTIKSLYSADEVFMVARMCYWIKEYRLFYIYIR